MSRENSALIALNELKNLEAQRVQQVVEDKRSKEDAERQRVEEAERKRREEAERVRREEEERMRLEQDEREQREREERIRVAETEARARAEQEGRLREEQMRLDAQVKMSERKKTPYWLYATAGVLLVGLCVLGYFGYQKMQENEAIAAQQEEDRKKHEAESAAQAKVIADLEAEKAKLEKEQAELDKAQKDLEAKLATATTDAEKAALLAEKDKLDADQASLTKKKKKVGGSSGGETKAGATKERKDSIKLGGGDNPLGDL
jgi:colicin import membrane protein